MVESDVSVESLSVVPTVVRSVVVSVATPGPVLSLVVKLVVTEDSVGVGSVAASEAVMLVVGGVAVAEDALPVVAVDVVVAVVDAVAPSLVVAASPQAASRAKVVRRTMGVSGPGRTW